LSLTVENLKIAKRLPFMRSIFRVSFRQRKGSGPHPPFLLSNGFDFWDAGFPIISRPVPRTSVNAPLQPPCRRWKRQPSRAFSVSAFQSVIVAVCPFAPRAAASLRAKLPGKSNRFLLEKSRFRYSVLFFETEFFSAMSKAGKIGFTDQLALRGIQAGRESHFLFGRCGPMCGPKPAPRRCPRQGTTLRMSLDIDAFPQSCFADKCTHIGRCPNLLMAYTVVERRVNYPFSARPETGSSGGFFVQPIIRASQCGGFVSPFRLLFGAELESGGSETNSHNISSVIDRQ